MAPPHVPTAAQLTALAALQATEDAALATYNANLVNVAAAKTTWMNAQASTAAYRAFLSGGQKSTVIDEGGADVT